jgi:predicted RNA binding protein YcfA (HicA-like mRNA interferase family)
MKRVDLVKMIEASGCVFVRHGGRHDWYRNPVTGVSQPVPRHREIPHIANAHTLPRVYDLLADFGLPRLLICTPAEFLGDPADAP